MKQTVTAILLLFGFTMAAAQQPTAPIKQPPAAAVAKTVATQKLAGRALDETGKPIFDASILIMPAGKNENLQQVLTGYRSASSDEQGRFEFDGLEPGAYRLVASAPGHVLAQDSVEEGGRPKLFRAGEVYTLRMVRGGVITGTVTDAMGEPVVAARVRAHRIKDEKGRAAMMRVAIDENMWAREWKTDDRGIYRLYGLEPGTYLVAAGGKGLNPMSIGAYDASAPAYHPAGTRDTAAPVTVQAGQEVSGIDIRWRESRGSVVSGKVMSPEGKGGGSIIVVSLTSAATGNVEGMAMTGFMLGNDTPPSFALSGVGDGEYRIAATAIASGSMDNVGQENMLLSPSSRITVKGSDVTGLELKLAPLGSISGQFRLEKMKPVPGAAACQPKQAATIQETVVAVRSDAKRGERTELPVISLSPFMYSSDGVPNEKGEFRVITMEAGRYRFDIRLPSEDWYLQSITQVREAMTEKEPAKEEAKAVVKEPAKEAKTKPASAAANAPRDLVARGLTVRMGERITGVRILAAEGAAAIKGQIRPEKAGEPLAGQWRVFLVPAEPEHADNLLRFYQTEAEKDGTYSISNIAPGRYLALVRAVSEPEASAGEFRPAAWDDDLRVTLRLAALAANHIIDLAPCQRLTSHTLRVRRV